jgi:hypothetical protein
VRIVRFAQVGTLALTITAVAACGSGNGSPTKVTAGPSTPVAAPAAPLKPTAVTGDQLCAMLGSNELATLVYGKSSAKPTPETAKGLAGCRWPVSGVGKDFSIFIDKDTGGSKREDFGEFAEVKLGVKGQALYRTTTGSSICDAAVYGPQVPATYYLSVKYETNKSQLKGQDPCAPTLTAVGTVLTKLGWAA